MTGRTPTPTGPDRRPRWRRRSSAVPVVRRVVGWGLGLLLPVLTTLAGVLARDLIGLRSDVVLFFLATVVVALVGGLGPALLAAFAGGLLLNYFLTPPVHTLTVAEQEDVVALVAMVLVAVLVALVVDSAARRAQQAAAARAEAGLLADFSRTVLTRDDPLPRLLDRVREEFGLTAAAVRERTTDGGWTVSARSGPPCSAAPERADVVVAVEPDVELVAWGRAPTARELRILEAVAGQALLALRTQQAAAAAAEARRRADASQLRSALLTAVGHDLRTPLASIKAAAGSLRDPGLLLSDTDRGDLAATVEESADRLTGVVENLLDSSRLATGAVVPDLRPVAYDDIAALALAGSDPALRARERVRIELDERVPEVLADAGLLERVLANLVDNALRHGCGAPVALRTAEHGTVVELRVVDRGPGVPAARAGLLFAPFQRLGDRTPGGLGLGLAVARGFTEAMGGTLTAQDTPGGGLTTVITLPAAPLPAELTP